MTTIQSMMKFRRFLLLALFSMGFLLVNSTTGYGQDEQQQKTRKKADATETERKQDPEDDAEKKAAKEEDQATINLEPSHKQIRVIRPELKMDEPEEDSDENKKGKKGEKEPKQVRAMPALKTFCLAYDGTILAGLSANNRHALQFLSPDGDLKQQVDLQFVPQVINQAPDGVIFIAGPGKLAKVSQAGKILTTVDAPWLGDPEELKAEVIAEMKERYSGLIENYRTTLKRLEARIEKIEEEMEDEEEPSERTEKRLAALKKQRDTQKSQIESLEEAQGESITANVDALVASRTSSTGIAVSSKDLYVCASGKGFSYEVWRMDHDFSSPEKVVKALGGCCGQCDIQCDEENLIVAANTEFAVQIRNRDGKKISKFGQRGGQAGFGSCCNPMNVKVMSDGDILTAESSIGWIKRFNREGELEAVIGKAKIGGGCKHVPIGFNEELDRYYMMYEDRGEICVLDAIASIKGPTEDEIAAQEARAGLGEKLIGKWKNTKAKKSGGAIRAIFGSGSDNASMLPETLEFAADGGLKIKGGQFGTAADHWEAVRQKDDVLTVALVDDAESGFNYEIKFLSDEKAEFRLMMDTHEFAKGSFNRITNEADEASSESEEKDDEAPDADEKPAKSSKSTSKENEKNSVKMMKIIPK
jgi:hypothetical protein